MSLSGLASFTLSPDEARTSRYSYIVFVLLAPSMAVVFMWLARTGAKALAGDRRSVPTALVVVLLLAYVANAVEIERTQTQFQVSFMDSYRSWVLGSAAATADDERILTPLGAGFNDAFDSRLVTAPQIRRELPKEPVSSKARLDAESQFFVGVGTEEFHLFAPARIDFEDGFTKEFVPGNRCETYRAFAPDPTLVLRTGSGNEIAIKSDSTKVTTQLRRGGLESASRDWSVKPGPVYIASDSEERRARWSPSIRAATSSSARTSRRRRSGRQSQPVQRAWPQRWPSPE